MSEKGDLNGLATDGDERRDGFERGMGVRVADVMGDRKGVFVPVRVRGFSGVVGMGLG